MGNKPQGRGIAWPHRYSARYFEQNFVYETPDGRFELRTNPE